MRTRFALAFALLVALATACAQDSPRTDASAPHWDAQGFHNTPPDFESAGFTALLKWRYEAWRDDLPKPPIESPPIVSPDLAFIAGNARAGAAMQPAVTFIGHSSVLAQLGGLDVLIDPMLSERASPLPFAGPRRHQPPGLAIGELPHIDVVLVSHNHYDHLDAATIEALARQRGGPPLYIAPLGLKAWLADEGITNAVELDWWQSREVQGPAGPVEVMLTPARHWSARGLNDRRKTLWGGFAVLAPGFHLFYSGDTGYSKDFVAIRERLAARQRQEDGGGFDLALLPIGAYEPRWFMHNQHVDPAEAVQIHLDLGAKRSMGVHWGTFELTDESLDEPPRALARARDAAGLRSEDFFVLAIGETRVLPRRSPSPSSFPGSFSATGPDAHR